MLLAVSLEGMVYPEPHLLILAGILIIGTIILFYLSNKGLVFGEPGGFPG